MPPSLSRRRLLHLIGSVAGSAAAYHAAIGLGAMAEVQAAPRPDLARPRARVKIAILGAGIAGLTAAYELHRKGYDVTVLEASHRAGGRNLTLRHGDLVDEIGNPQVCAFDPDPDLYLNAGPARIPGHHTTLLDYCRELGVDLAPFINENRNAWVQDDAAFGGKPVRNREYVTDARGFLAELTAKCISASHLDAAVTREDAERLIAFTRVFGDLNAKNSYQGSARAGLASYDYTMPAQLKSVRELPELLKSRLWQIVMNFGETEDQAAMMMEPVGGMDRVVQGFMAQIGSLVKTRARVEAVMLREKSVEVVYRDADGRHKLAADYCLNSIPFQLMAGIANNFPRDYAAVLTAIPRGKLFKIGFQMRERFWEREMIYGGISWTTQDITQIWYPCHGIHRRKGVVLGAYVFGGAAADRFERMTHAQRLEAAIAQGARIHPEYGSYVENGVSIPWHRMNNMLGCAAEWEPELRAKFFARIQAPVGRHYMIGDQVSYHSGWQQGAMHSALHALADIDRRVRAELGTKGVAA
ncbi:MAG TPA: FAD-dependent oxidoreductase [Steroidobacteraceae bacterium]|nr:FAD-dependent oxidoreductase [Steroidobacteraceae bacterium]